ncbi:MAG: hypothetical protein LBV20_00760, partial [Treponema sp.]|nr:hypothetical protein [Treponema sp.]
MMSSLRRCLQTISRVLRYISPVFFLLLIFPAAAQEAEFTPPPNSDIETLTELIVPEDPAHILDLNVWDTDVSLFLSGYWKGTLGGNLGLSLTPLGMTAASTDSPILFTQETDISLSLWIKERWFVEASFLDEYAMNTFRAGYQGISGEFIQYVGIGNTGLDFPVYPYLDLGGSSGASPGIYGRFGTDTLTIHSMFRYDAAVRESRVYVGERERTYSYISVENSVRGRSFVLPDDDLDSIPIVYIEDSEGTYRGSDKRRYRIAENSELAASRAYGIIELANSPEGRVAVSYTKGSNTPWDISMGNYSDTQGSSFLGNVQHHFSGYPLTQYTQPGQEDASKHIPGTITISINGNTVSALIVYEPGTFSPFERQSRYDAPSSNTSTADLVTLSTEERIGGYEVLPLDSLLTTSDVQLDLEDQPQREMYELTKYGDYGNRRSAESRWPLTEISKEIYLPIRQDNNEDMSIRFTNYGNSGAYSLGTDIVPGSVKVYRGEIEDPRFTFDAESGVVALEYPAAFNEVVRITYLRQNNQRDFVSFAGGIGADYHPGGPFSSSIALGFRWNNNDSAFSEAALSNQGTVGLSGQAAWSEENFNANISAGAVIDQPDSSGLYRIAGMEGASKIIELSASNSFISEVPEDPLGTLSSSVLTDQNRAALIYRNYSESSLLGSSLHPIEWNNAEIVSTEEGPYPVRDNAVDSDILAAEFSLSNEKIWAGFQSPLGDDHGLNNAEQIDIPIRLYDFDTQLPSDFTITVQFGALKDQEDH